MGKSKVYKEQEPILQKVSESMAVYSKIDSGTVTSERDNIKLAIPVKNYWIGFALV